ncbi:MAG: hypothetical protein JW702_02020 [Clostridiales bacterium]|nr:hypothetical protein [Clostridiales bacterium]
MEIRKMKGLKLVLGILFVLMILYIFNQSSKINKLESEIDQMRLEFIAFEGEQDERKSELEDEWTAQIETLSNQLEIRENENMELERYLENKEHLIKTLAELMLRDDYDFLLRLYDLNHTGLEKELVAFSPAFLGEENLELNLKLIAYSLQEYFFNGYFRGSVIEVVGIEEIEGKRVAVINLKENKSNNLSWKGNYFQGSLGAMETETRLINSFLQPEIDLEDWIDGVRFTYEDEEISIGHVEQLMSGVIWRTLETKIDKETRIVDPIAHGDKIVYESRELGIQMTADKNFLDDGLLVRVDEPSILVLYYVFPNGERYDFGFYSIDDDNHLDYHPTLDVWFENHENYVYYHELYKENIHTKYGIEAQMID